MAEWKRVKLGDVADIFTGYPFESSRYTGHPDSVRLLRGDNVVQGTLRWDGVKRWPASALTEELKKYELQEGDVVVAMDRPWIEAGLKYASIENADVPALLVQRVARLRPGAGVQPGFLKYIVGSKSFTDHVLAVQTGTAVPHISMGQIKSYEFLLPSADHQKAVVALLGALDDKIGVYRRMCATLDELHRALFANLESDLEVCESACTVGDVAQLVRKGVEPMATPDRTFLHFSIPAFDSDRQPVRERGTAIRSNKFVVPHGSVLLSKLNPSIERVWVPGIRSDDFAVCSTEFLVFMPTEWATRTFLYGLFTSPRLRAALCSTVTGTSNSHQRVRPDDVLAIAIDPPSRNALARFDAVASPLLDRIQQARDENRTLAELRDGLLPLLLSGEVCVSDAEREVAFAT